MNLSEQIKTAIVEHSKRDFPLECCGLIGDSVFPCKNIATKPTEEFLISKAESNAIIKENLIVGYYHSHPNNSSVSEKDKFLSEKLKLPCVVYRLDGQFEIYEPNGIPIPYENRPFILGALDCLNLVMDYYKNELNLEIKDINLPCRNLDWLNNPEILKQYNNKNATFLKDHLIENGFEEVTDFKKHDVLITTAYKFKCPIHYIVYLGDEQILHHCAGCLSVKEKLPDYFQKRITSVMRHKTLL